MGTLVRGSKNAFRNSIRTVSITIILALSIALALVMLLSLRAVESRIDEVKADIGNTITVRSAGLRGFQGGGELLTADAVKTIANTDHVTVAIPMVEDRLNTEGSTSRIGPGGQTNSSATTSLTSPIEPGTLGQRFGGPDQNSNNGGITIQAPEGFTLPVTVTGTTDPLNPRVLQVDDVELTAGTTIDGTGSARTALVGVDLAEKNNLSVGSTFTAYGETLTVAGIYDAGDTFSNASIIVPLATLQELSDQDGVTSVLVQVDSIENIESTTAALEDSLGDTAAVTSDATNSEDTLENLDSVRTIALYGLIGALIAGATIIFLTMLMIVRERRREIGVLKAIGGSNAKISFQFVAEALTFTMMATAAGLLIGVLLSNPVLDVLVDTNSSPAATATLPVGGPPGAVTGGPGGAAQVAPPQGDNGPSGRIQFGPGITQGFTDFGGTIDNLNTAVGLDVLLFGVFAALFIAILGSAIPSFFIAKVRPAEVMRSE